MKTVRDPERAVPPHIIRGATIGARVWKGDLADNSAAVGRRIDAVTINMDPFDAEWEAQVAEEWAASEFAGQFFRDRDWQVQFPEERLKPVPLNLNGTEKKPTANEFASDEQRRAFFALLAKGHDFSNTSTPKGVAEARKGIPKDDNVRKARAAYNQVLKRATPRAKELIAANAPKIVHQESLDELTKNFAEITGKTIPDGAKVGGYYKPGAKSVNVDGPVGGGMGGEYAYKSNQGSHAHVMAHELAHAIDFKGQFSNSIGWQKAWMEEIVKNDRPLTGYATTHPSEGFAEFYRAASIYGSEDVKDKFPKCYAYMQERGLIE